MNSKIRMTKTSSAARCFEISHSDFLRHSTFGIRHWLTVTFSHHEIERTQDGHHIADRVFGQHPGQDAQVNEGGRADFQAVRRSTPLAVDVKAQFALRVFGAEINLAGGALTPWVTSMNW